MHELKLIVDLLHEGGLRKMHEFISDTAAYGDLTRGPRVVDEHARQKMQEILDEIRDGTFARQWIEENESGQTNYRRMMDADLSHPIEKVGAELRSHMDWLETSFQSRITFNVLAILVQGSGADGLEFTTSQRWF